MYIHIHNVHAYIHRNIPPVPLASLILLTCMYIYIHIYTYIHIHDVHIHNTYIYTNIPLSL